MPKEFFKLNNKIHDMDFYFSGIDLHLKSLCRVISEDQDPDPEQH
jgi:hypothetical protein